MSIVVTELISVKLEGPKHKGAESWMKYRTIKAIFLLHCTSFSWYSNKFLFLSKRKKREQYV
jgi:hypothetical protein